ncbi:unnamed protein product [Notodromas monacha]|uniref:Coiled-coil domain-containing protein 103 n=1 Tax=Notodromas monacha TaxID=399045 RepID=A0A7R9GBF8_9CRUS|nr:unnamed protein product [Notodromas monacha]CAG0914962.1 unnamed protein product [Notodromas monacha]
MDSTPGIFEELERDLSTALEKNSKYLRENEAKLKAVNEAKDYEEFKNRVDACHLRPLSKKELESSKRRASVWNSWQEKSTGFHQRSSEVRKFGRGLPQTCAGLEAAWSNLDSAERFGLLNDLGPDTLASIFGIQVPLDMTEGIMEALHEASKSTRNSDSVVSILKVLVSVKRFSINVACLTETQRGLCSDLLENVFHHAEQDGSGNSLESQALYQQFKDIFKI